MTNLDDRPILSQTKTRARGFLIRKIFVFTVIAMEQAVASDQSNLFRPFDEIALFPCGLARNDNVISRLSFIGLFTILLTILSKGGSRLAPPLLQ